MKFKIIIIVAYVLSMIICFFGTQWYYQSKYNKESIRRGTVVVEFCDFLLGSPDNRKETQRIIKGLKEVQIKLLAKDLSVPYDGDQLSIMQKIDKDNYKLIHTKN